MSNESEDDLGQCISLPENRKQQRRERPLHRLRADVEWRNVEHLLNESDEVVFAPPDPKVEQYRASLHEHSFELAPEEEEEEEESLRFQFSIRELLILNAVLAVLFALLRVLAPSWMAGSLGIVTLLTAIMLAVYQPESRRVEMAWWCMLLIYLATCAFAIYS